MDSAYDLAIRLYIIYSVMDGMTTPDRTSTPIACSSWAMPTL